MTFAEWLYLHGYDSSYADITSSKGQMLYRQYQKALKDGNAGVYNQYVDKYKNGDITAIDLQGALANSGVQISPEQSQWINNEISQQVTNEARDYNTEMRDSSLTSSAGQLASLGLNPASVLQTGGSGIGSSPVSDTSKGNPALEKSLADFNQKAALTRTLVGLIGGLGSAGILGSTRLLARKAASVAAASAANSGIHAIRSSGGEANWNKLLQELDF